MSPKNSNGTAAERRRQWLARNGTTFIPGILEGYRTLGRGVLVIHEPPNPSHTPAVYMDALSARMSTQLSLDDKTLEWIRDYNPDLEFVAIVIDTKGGRTSYRLQLPGRGDSLSA